MDQKDILETVICEMTERALAIRRETCEEAEQQLIRAGYTSDQYKLTRMKSVAEIESLLGKRAFDALLSDQVVQAEGNLTLVPEEDKRVEYSSADAAFADMTDMT